MSIASLARMKLCFTLLSFALLAQGALISHLRLKQPDYFDYDEEEPSQLLTVFSTEIDRLVQSLTNLWTNLNSKVKVGGRKCVVTFGPRGIELCLPKAMS